MTATSNESVGSHSRSLDHLLLSPVRNKSPLSPVNGHSISCTKPRVAINAVPLLSVPWKYLTVDRIESSHIQGYERHRCDVEFVKSFHKEVNGMITEFRRGVMDVYEILVGKLESMKTPRGLASQNDWRRTLKTQFEWAKVHVLRLQVGLSSYDTFAVDMLCDDYLIRHVDGCCNYEMALFLHLISTCKTFDISSKPIVMQGVDGRGKGEIVGYDIVAKFDNDVCNHLFGTSVYDSENVSNTM